MVLSVCSFGYASSGLWLGHELSFLALSLEANDVGGCRREKILICIALPLLKTFKQSKLQCCLRKAFV